MTHLILALALSAVPALAQDDEPAEPEPDEASEQAEAQAEIEALRARLDELKERLDAQQTELGRQRSAAIDKDDLKLSVEGWYRVRGTVIGGVDPDSTGKVMTHRLRLRPIANYRDLAVLKMDIDGLTDVVWGDNQSLASTALFATDVSETGLDGRSRVSFELERVWIEAAVPALSLRAGRMPSDWGMGLLANNGDGFDDRFGENHAGSTVDRVLLATRPIAIGQAIAGKEDSDIPFFLAFGIDRIVEDPLIQYYGYRCEPGIDDPSPDYDPRCDSDGDGITDADHSWTDAGRTDDQRGGDWWVDSADDVAQLIFVAIYRGEDVKVAGAKGDLTAGTYVVYRTQDETESTVLIVDGYLHARWRGAFLEAEGLHIGGQTRAITLPGAIGSGDDPLGKTADIWGYVARAGYGQGGWEALIETGYASGDDNVADDRFTGRSIHPEFNVGLLLYEEILARVTAELWTETARGLWSNGGVYNSRYLHPVVVLRPFEGVGETELIGAFLVVWPDKPDGAIIRCVEADGCPQALATSGPLGYEVDLAIKHTWHRHLSATVEFGWAKATDRLPLEQAGLDPDGTFFTVQSRLGFEF